jgi:hypothetical protein
VSILGNMNALLLSPRPIDRLSEETIAWFENHLLAGETQFKAACYGIGKPGIVALIHAIGDPQASFPTRRLAEDRLWERLKERCDQSGRSSTVVSPTPRPADGQTIVRITVERRGRDFLAHLNDDRAEACSGQSVDRAIGALVRTRCSDLGIEIDLLGQILGSKTKASTASLLE